MQALRDLIRSARGIYLDEVHHASCKTATEVLAASPLAYWKYGGSATPIREDGAEIMIQALFGQKIVDISASYLINKGYLIKPYIFFDPISHDCKLHSYQSIYKECISQNEKFNGRVVDLAKYFMSKKLNVLILVQQYVQGEMIQKQLPELEFVTGKMKRSLRKEALNKVKNGEKMGVIGTTLYDEGVDCPCLDVVLMAGGGASATRVYQRIGRALRKHGNKDKAAVIYFQHHVKHLEKHAKKAKKIMKLEPAFEIIESAGCDFLFNELNEIFKFDSDSESIMDI
jgi:superfamily II DNA or RNA helicase